MGNAILPFSHSELSSDAGGLTQCARVLYIWTSRRHPGQRSSSLTIVLKDQPPLSGAGAGHHYSNSGIVLNPYLLFFGFSDVGSTMPRDGMLYT